MRGVKEFLNYRAKLELILKASPQFILGRSYLVLFINFKVKIFICYTPHIHTHPSQITPGKAMDEGSDLNVDIKTKFQKIGLKMYFIVFLYQGIPA